MRVGNLAVPSTDLSNQHHPVSFSFSTGKSICAGSCKLYIMTPNVFKADAALQSFLLRLSTPDTLNPLGFILST